MSIAYVPPGVSVIEQSAVTLSPQLATPGTVCLVGPASGSISRVDQIALTDTVPSVLYGVPLQSPPTSMSSGQISLVADIVNPSVGPFHLTTDYTFASTTVGNFTTYALTRVVTSQTLSTSVTAGATTATLSSGAVPTAGQTVRFGSIANPQVNPTETLVVKSVAGQVLTFYSPLQNSYASPGRVTWGNIPDGDTVAVSYSYTPSDYYLPTRLTNMSDIQQRYGNAWDSTGTSINSPLSFAAGLAFQNGATSVVLQPLYVLTNNGPLDLVLNPPLTPTATQCGAATTWQTVYNNLLDLEDISFVVPVIGQGMLLSGVTTNVTDSSMLQIEQATNFFVGQMKAGPGIYVIALMGEDSTTSTTGASVASEPILQAHAQQIQAQSGGIPSQCVLLNSASFQIAAQNTLLNIGGQYVAAALGGMLAGAGPTANVTRQFVSGILSVNDTRTIQAKNQDAGSGLMVLENRGNLVQIRHATTCDTSSVVTRELNVIIGKGYLVASVKNTLDTQVIGQLVADSDAPTLVNNVVIGTLEDLRGLDVIIDYANVQSQITSYDPTAMAVQFSYIPSFIVNYITITFSLDLTTQAVSVNESPTQ